MTEPHLRRTLATRSRVEIPKIKGSRFVATAQAASDPGAQVAALAAVRAEMPDATHHCWAWQGEHPDTYRFSDDGEPSGSAGRPILSAIAGRGLSAVLVVVTRFYGGTKLGTGGLVRAYGGAAAAALDAATTVVQRPEVSLTLRFGYELSGAVDGVLAAHGITPCDSDYGAEVCLRVRLAKSQESLFVADLSERTAGRVRWNTNDR